MNKLNNILNKYFKDNGNFDVDDFIHAYGDPRQALVLFRIYHPNLIEINGNVVLEYYIDAENGPEKLITLLEKKEKSKKDILSGYRWLEIPCLFADNPLEEEMM